MLAVKVDSNVHKKAATSRTDSFITGRILKEYHKDGDVEKLLGSHTPMRARSSSLRGRLPSSPHESTQRSQSPSAIRRQAFSLDAILAKTSRDQEQQAVNPTNSIDMDNTLHRNENKMDVSDHSPAHGRFGTSRTQTPFKADHTMPPSIFKSLGSFSPSASQGGKLTSDDTKSEISCRINRSRSLSRLNGSPSRGESSFLPDNHCKPALLYDSVSDIQHALEKSESHRRALLLQQKAVQATLQMQSEQLNKITSSANNNNILLESLQLKEKQYHNMFKQLQASEQDKHVLEVKNLKLQEEMQNRINALDYQLRHLKSHHQNIESKNNKNVILLDHTTTALTLMEDNNSKLQQENEILQSEISLLRESLEIAKTKNLTLEDDNSNMKNECDKLKEVNTTLSKKVQDIAGQMVELHSLLKAVKDENEHLVSTMKTYTQDKSWTVRQIQEYQDTISHLKSRLGAASADRDRLFQEKLEMNNKVQEMLFDKEHLMKTQLILDDQIIEQRKQQSYQKTSEIKADKEKLDMQQELVSLMKTKEDLSTELTLLRELYKQALEQIAVLDWDKSVLQSQCSLSELEKSSQLLQELNKFNLDSSSGEQQSRKNHLLLTESNKFCEKCYKLQLEYNNLKQEYDLLAVNRQLLGHDDKMEKRELEITKEKKEKDSLKKQVSLLQGQVLLIEGDKKRADEHISKLTSDLEDFKEQLKRSSKCSPIEESLLKQEIEMLKQQLDKAKEDQQSQQNFIESLREKTTIDERSELQQLKDKLHELYREMEQKTQTIDSLKFELKSLQETAEAKKQSESEKSTKSKVESINHSSGKLCDQRQEDNEVTSSQKPVINSLPRSGGPTKLFSKSWAPAPKWKLYNLGSSLDSSTFHEANNFNQVPSPKAVRKLPPPPPPKPSLKSVLSPALTDSRTRDTELVASDSDIITDRFSVQWTTLLSPSPSENISSSGLGQPAVSSENNESQEHNNVNDLILKFEDMTAF